MDNDWTKKFKKRFAFLSPRESADCIAFNCPASNLLELGEALAQKEGFDLLVDLTAVDWGEESSPRFSTVCHFYSLSFKNYLRIVIDCSNNVEPEIPSLATLFPGADWHEREVFDMFGIRFSNHPNLKRILMWDGYPHFPLRKDFPLAGEPTELPAADVAEDTGVSVLPAPMMGGPFVAPSEGHVSQSEPRGKDQSWTEERGKPR
tara:strand:- start:510 stop:1124 length:615 start_codon:yes stop_codon:yes gene_type:complete